MANRREFIQHTIAATASLAGARVAFASKAGALMRSWPLKEIIYDRDSAEGVEFGAAAVRRKIAARAIGGDIGGVWMNELEPRWKQAPAAIAGLTTGGPLFCLEYLARDYGMGLVYRLEHTRLADGRVHHRGEGGTRMEHWIDALTAAGENWPAVASVLAATYPADSPPVSPIDLIDLAATRERETRTLFSWVLAPLAGRRSFAAAPFAGDSAT